MNQIPPVNLKSDFPAHSAALAFGTQSLILTGAIKIWQNPDNAVARSFFDCITSSIPHIALLLIIALLLLKNALGLFENNQKNRALVLGFSALLFGSNTAIIAYTPSGLLLFIYSIVLMILLASFIPMGIRNPKTLAARGMFLVLGMIIFDLASDLPFLLSGKNIEISYLNNTIHIGTLVHLFWLPLSLASIGIGIALALYRKQRGSFLWLIPLLALGAFLLYGIVEPKEAQLENLAINSEKASELLHAIALSHSASFIILLIGVWLIYPKKAGKP